MKPKSWFPRMAGHAALFFASTLILSSCYTHLATNDGGYYTYHHRPIYSDTLRGNSSATKTVVTYDTTMHGDTMFIDEHQVAAPAANLADGIEPNENGNTIINNYYGSGYGSAGYWDSYWGPSWGLSVGFGWPYYSWYSPWWPYYYSPNWYADWYSPFGYFGAYPPFYSAYYGYPYYNGFGYRHFRHDFDGDGYGYGNGYGIYSNIRPGRIGGEYRLGTAAPRGTLPGIAGVANSPVPSALAARSNFEGTSAPVTNTVAQAQAADVLRSEQNRNAPVHVLSPDAATTRNEIAPATASLATETTHATSEPAASNSHPIVVRRMDNGQTITTSNQSGRQMVVVRRSAGNGSGNYRGSRSSYRNNAAARGYAPAKNSNNSSGDYSAPSRSYSPPERSSSPSERSYSPPERASAPAESGRSYGGGESSGRAGGGEGRAR